jgi:hypothetical protein
MHSVSILYAIVSFSLLVWFCQINKSTVNLDLNVFSDVSSRGSGSASSGLDSITSSYLTIPKKVGDKHRDFFSSSFSRINNRDIITLGEHGAAAPPSFTELA